MHSPHAPARRSAPHAVLLPDAPLAPAAVDARAVPAVLTPLLGRDDALRALAGRLVDARLLTLTGTGGSGKTRLALELAHEILDGRLLLAPAPQVAWVELAPLAAGERVAAALADALGVAPTPGHDLVTAIALACRATPRLVVLDNCEHLVAAVAALATTLLTAAPSLRLVATSREPLGVPGEVTWPVPPLGEEPAVRLFVDRARDATPGFALTDATAREVAALCRQLDGLPLAIELAAARVRALAPGQLLARAADLLPLLRSPGRGVPDRHRTLEATLDWSYRLLGDDEQALLRALSAFVGSFTLDAVELLWRALREAGHAAGDADPLDLLASLVERSLVATAGDADAPRYRLLETVRQFAAQRLRASGEGPLVARAHAHRAAAFVERASRLLASGARPRTEREVAAELDDLRAALAWAVATPGEGPAALRIAGSLWIHMMTTSQWPEGMRMATAALAAGERDGADGPWRTRTLYAATLFTWIVEPRAALVAQVAEVCARAEREGDAELHALALALHARVLIAHDAAAALAMAGRAMEAASRLPVGWAAAHAMAGADGFVGRMVGDFARAREGNARAERLWRAVDDPWGLHLLWTEEALVALAERRWDDAVALMRRVVGELAAEPSWLMARALEIVAVACEGAGEARAAARILGAADRARELAGDVRGTFERGECHGVRDRLAAALGADGLEAAWLEGRALAPAAAVALAPGGDVPAGDGADVPEYGWPIPDLLLLGGFALRIDDVEQPATAWPYAKPRELCAFLACHPEGRTKEQIGLALWPDASPAQLRNNLHVTLHHVRRALGDPEWVLYEGGRYHLATECGLRSDLARFHAALARAQAAQRVGDDAGRRDALRAAVAEWRGAFCEGEAFGSWAEDARDGLRVAYHDALEALATIEERAAEHDAALATWRRAAAEDPLWEAAQRGVVRALVALGRRGEAIAHGQRVVERLARELDAEPEPETAALLASIGG